MPKLRAYLIAVEDVNFNYSFDSNFDLNNTVDTHTDIHVHVDFEIFINISGTLTVNTNNGSYMVNESNLVIIPPFMHHYTVNSNDSVCYKFMIQFGAKKDGRNVFFDTINGLFSQDKINVYSIQSDSIYIFCKELNHALSGNTAYAGNERITALLTLITLKIADLSDKRVDNNLNDLHKTNYSDEIYRIIAKNYMENIRLSDIAKSISLCDRQTSRIIKKHYGKSFSQLLAEKRLSTAAQLLIKTDLPIKEIIARVNFETDSYFFVLFKRTYHLSPLKYREKYTGAVEIKKLTSKL